MYCILCVTSATRRLRLNVAFPRLSISPARIAERNPTRKAKATSWLFDCGATPVRWPRSRQIRFARRYAACSGRGLRQSSQALKGLWSIQCHSLRAMEKALRSQLMSRWTDAGETGRVRRPSGAVKPVRRVSRHRARSGVCRFDSLRFAMAGKSRRNAAIRRPSCRESCFSRDTSF